MDIRPLRYLVTVADLGSFTLAAERLGVAQPAVSMSIRNMEKQMGLSLLDRGEKRVKPTAEGAILLVHARRILDEVEAAELALNEARGLTKGEVRIGIPSMLGSYYFPPILMAFKHRHQSLNLAVFEDGTRSIQKKIREGDLDVGVIVADRVPKDLEAAPFLQEEMVVCVPHDHRFAEQKAVSFADFFEEELVLFKEGYFHREFIDRVCEKSGSTPKVAFESNLIPLTKSIVRQGFGITVFLKMVLKDEPDLVAIPFEERVFLNMSIAWKKGAYQSLADRAFVDFLLEHAEVAAD
ncbi:LysR family transcriptional regulator [Marinospirillum insulare]|uniref:LysR family transcriptional regulator n=1 Tax=Marinospirillum insulare TaxID=217169 RepID=A0ABQ5ZZR3_9GAMM|nr:LysR family transcriptional regulator [Marinospirillum insulare]GLR64573.1 LysR family transcriptional regulator [Marinospirillum insulare]